MGNRCHGNTLAKNDESRQFLVQLHCLPPGINIVLPIPPSEGQYNGFSIRQQYLRGLFLETDSGGRKKPGNRAILLFRVLEKR